MAVLGQEPAESGSPPSRWLVPALSLAAFVNTTSAIGLGPFLPFVAEDLGTSVALLGQVPSAMMLLAALLGLVIGPLADQYGYRRMLVGGLLTLVVSAFATGLAPTVPILLLVTMVGSVGRAAVMPTAQAVVGAQPLDADARRRSISWLATGHTTSAVLGVPILTTIAAFSHWRVSFFVLGGVALGIALLLWRFLAPDESRVGTALRLRSVLSAYAPLWRHRPSLGLVAQTFVGGAGTWAVFTYLGAYLVQQHGFSAVEVGWAYLAVGVGAVASTRIVGSRLGSRPRVSLLLSRALGGLTMGAALILPLPVLAVVAVLVVGIMLNVVNTATTAVVLVGESPAGRATTMTLNSSGLSLGSAVGGMVGGLVLTVGGYEALGLVAMIWLLLAAVLVWWSRPREVAVPSPALQ